MPHSKNDEISPRILFLDAYDSFSNNIVALLKSKIDCDVDVIKIDDPRYLKQPGAFEHLLISYDAVVAGPGPGNPTCAEDVGLIGCLWRLREKALVPVLGICLGFQSLACSFGGYVGRLKEPRHGIVQQIQHSGTLLFADAGNLYATQYHSLRIDLGYRQEDAASSSMSDSLWKPSKACPELEPLGWVRHDDDNGTTLMAIRHLRKPFWGVQFHPESICSDAECQKIVRNWWIEAAQWRRAHPRHLPVYRHPDPFPDVQQPRLQTKSTGRKCQQEKVLWVAINKEALCIPDICAILNDTQINKPVVLESGTTKSGRLVNPETGRFSIIGLTDDAEHIQYYTSSRHLRRFRAGTDSADTPKIEVVLDVWQFLSKYMKHRTMAGGPPASPFWGGLVGFASYEGCLDTIGLDKPTNSRHDRPDLWFIFIQRSIVIDHVSNQVYIQSTLQHDEEWIADTKTTLQSLHTHTSQSQYPSHLGAKGYLNARQACSRPARIQGPTKHRYTRKVLRCQQNIRAGDAYELCLTDQTHISLPLSPCSDSWNLYLRLRTMNPAPFAAYLEFNSKSSAVTILSSSPERFLSWSRTGHCQFRPIKGTVKKTPGMTRAKAEAILSSSKERAENLMIVDLIRHDLHGVVGAGNVKVEKLMSVEEYETVYQLVSVIEGQLPCDMSSDGNANSITKSGIDVLAASLPPGSMTGAPKRRSCQLLQEIEENQPRGAYSGVLGYMDVGGGGDFSVVIRTASSWADDVKDGRRTWTVGAGGAVTSQSTDVGEWDEMLGKRDALLKVFEALE